MRGIDISNWQAGIYPPALEIDFCICKATEGLGYTDPCCDDWISQLSDNGIPWGFYHFARENEPEDEARYFYDECRGYFGRGIPVLDYETENYDNREWCERFISKLHELSGIWPMIYISASRIPEYDGSWIPQECGLWVAGYPYPATWWVDDDMPYSIGDWEFAAIWQFTSSLVLAGYEGHLDGDIAYMDVEAWAKYAGSAQPQPQPQPQPAPGISTDELAQEVIAGLWGNDQERVDRLGDRYDAVQARVNEYYTVAEQVINGDWGNGWNRKQALEGAGFDYQTVQNIVNEMLGV